MGSLAVLGQIRKSFCVEICVTTLRVYSALVMSQLKINLTVEGWPIEAFEMLFLEIVKE